MKKTITNHLIRSISVLPWVLLLVLQVTDISAQSRAGSIDMTGGEGRKIYLNRDNSNKALGVEGSAFTIEAWVYLEENGNDNFNFVKFRSGDGRFSLHYRGDSYKSGDAWEVEAKGIGYGERDWRLAYNENGTTGPDMMQKWRHVAFTSNGGSVVTLYIDGVERWSYSLVKSGEGAIASLFPSKGTDGDCMMGGEAVNSNSEGKMYMAEVRLWKVQLPGSTIAKYYDEEVNSSHPNWTSLIRYYQGHQFNSNGTFEDVSPVDEYDAGRSSTDISVATDQTPGIKPGDFSTSAINTDFKATTCNTDGNIDVTWEDFQGLTTYRNYTTPRYEVKRVNDGAVVLDDNKNSFQDGANPGNERTYQLNTYWWIGDTKYYSDYTITTNVGTVTEEFAAPNGFSASDNNCDASIDLSWQSLTTAPPSWKILRATNSGFTDETTLTSTLDGRITSYEDKNINSEQTYYYKVIATGDDANGCPIVASFSTTDSGRSSFTPTAPTGFTVTVDQANDEIDLSWTNPSNSLADGYIFIRQKEDGTDRIEITINDKDQTTYSDDNIEVCETYEYSIAAFNECFPDGIYSNTTHSALLGQDLNDYIVSMTASKGYYSNNVRLDWEINGGLSQIDNFVVERAPAGTIDYQSIGGVVDNVVFLDETAVAGTFYTYRVYAQSTCNGIVSSTNSATDIGFRQPFGVVSGHVQYSGGNAVEDVAINFERQDGASVGKSLRFDGDGDYVAIDGFYYQGTDYPELTVETWFKTTSEDDMIIASFDHGEYWRFEINGDYGSPGKLAFAIDKPIYSFESTNKVNDGEWHHVAVVFDNGQLSMYIDGELDKSENIGSATFGSGLKRYGFIGSGSETTSFNGWSTPSYHFDGNMDEFRIWSVARSKDEIERDYNRLLSNDQDGLEVYYRFDEGTGSQVFDAAKTGEIFNKHDGTFVGGVNFSEEIPDSDLLGVKGITDEFGDYTADYIPYVGSGDVFRVTPSFGQHAFEPNSKSIFLGDGAAVQ
ncbi:MAG: LamG-like jellyroll fold domain-containing protein, partial [Bacteroidota bacterium]